MLFSDRGLWTMIHGLVLSGGALVMLVVALFALWIVASRESDSMRARRAFANVTTLSAVLLWFSVIGGTYVVFPLYRAAPPEGVTALAAYPRALLLSNPGTAWLHSFAMEIKEHVPWIAAMIVTAVAFVARRPGDLLGDSQMRRLAATCLVIATVLVAGVALLGVFVNKVAPVW
jgi:hypothetical protein